MSIGELTKVESIENISGRLFDEQLKKLNLNKDQIDVQKLPELRESLSRINEAIAHPEGFGEFFVQYSAKVGFIVAQSTSDYNRKIGILPILLARKKMILDRIRELSANEKMDSIEDLADQLSEGEIKRKLTEELHILRDNLSEYKKDMQEITASETEAKIKLEQQRIDGLERKSKIWLSFLQRESAASIIGGIVLLMLTVALISGMIFGKESQILSNGFLVILGYFFGQSSSKNKDSI